MQVATTPSRDPNHSPAGSTEEQDVAADGVVVVAREFVDRDVDSTEGKSWAGEQVQAAELHPPEEIEH